MASCHFNHSWISAPQVWLTSSRALNGGRGPRSETDPLLTSGSQRRFDRGMMERYMESAETASNSNFYSIAPHSEDEDELEHSEIQECYDPNKPLSQKVMVSVWITFLNLRIFQVRSLTQLYSVDFSHSRIGVISALITNAQSRFASVVFDGISVVPETTHEASWGPLKGAMSAQKALQGSERETRELLGGTTENSVSPTRGHCFFYQKGMKKLS